MKCYVLGAVTGSGEDANIIFEIYKLALKDKVEMLGTPLETAQFTGSAEERFARAESSVKNADVIIAEVGTASTGAGIELGLAHMLNKKIICFAKKGCRVSGLVIGMVGSSNVIYYDDEKDLYRKLKSLDFHVREK